MVVTFVGHSLVFPKDHVKELVKEQLRKNCAGVEKVTCYLGGYGDFDNICACACNELKKERGGVEVVYVTPYFSFSEQEKIKELLKERRYDTTVYPPIENVPLRFAIIKRNEWMVKNAELIIAYVDHTYGGAYKSFQKAVREKKRIINICDFL